MNERHRTNFLATIMEGILVNRIGQDTVRNEVIREYFQIIISRHDSRRRVRVI